MTEPMDAIHARLVALCALIEDVETVEAWWPEDGVPFAAEELPAIVVNPAPSINNTILSATEFTVAQDWFINLFVARFPYDYKLRDRETWALVRPYVYRVPQFFNRRRSLQLNDAGIVRGISLPSVYTLAPATFDRAMYATVGFRMTTFSIQE